MSARKASFAVFATVIVGWLFVVQDTFAAEPQPKEAPAAQQKTNQTQPEDCAERSDCLTNDKAIQLLGALRQLDGYQHIVKNGNTENVVQVHYLFDAATAYAISTDIFRLEFYQQSLQQTVKRIHDQLADKDDGKNLSTTAAVKFQEELGKIGRMPADVTLVHIKADGLKLNENPIPVGTVLSAMIPIIDK